MIVNFEQIQKIPKTDLHLHLDGSLRIETLIDLAKKSNLKLPSFNREGLEKTVFKEHYKDLGEYLQGFAYTCAVLQDSQGLEQVAYELAIDNQNEGVFYIEPRFAPQLLINSKQNFKNCLLAVNKGLQRATQEFNQQEDVKAGLKPSFNYGIIVCAMRMFGPYSQYYQNLYDTLPTHPQKEVMKIAAKELVYNSIKCRDELGIPIVALDLAGQEDGHPASDYIEAYQLAHESFLNKTVHAGEAYGAQSIFEAISDIHADRLGHGYYLFDTSKIDQYFIGNEEDKKKYINFLVNTIAQKRITIEVCLTSNMQTNPTIGKLENHSFKLMLENKLSITICTDNRLVSKTTVSDEYLKAISNFDIDQKQLREIVLYGHKRSFYPGSYLEKRKWIRKIMDYYDQMIPRKL